LSPRHLFVSPIGGAYAIERLAEFRVSMAQMMQRETAI
jgi:hypothetical protein